MRPRTLALATLGALLLAVAAAASAQTGSFASAPSTPATGACGSYFYCVPTPTCAPIGPCTYVPGLPPPQSIHVCP
jgi:hypothetical protein